MRLRIVHKLFIALILVSSVSLIVLGGMTHWSLGRGFLHYVNQVEKEKFEKLVEGLSDEYRLRGSWEPLRSEPGRFVGVIRRSLQSERPAWREAGPGVPNRYAMSETGVHDAFRTPAAPASHGFHLLGRLTVYDASHNPVFGDSLNGPQHTMLPITVRDEVVGWLDYLPLRKLAAAPDVDFLRQQHETLIASVLALAVLAAILAVMFARQLSRPISAITQTVRQLAAGQFSVRLRPAADDELGHLASDVNRLAVTLEANESARRRWVADISHELRTPLAVLRGEVEAVQDGIRGLDEEFVRSVDTETRRLSQLVEDLYQLSMSDIGALAYRFAACPVAEVLERSLAGYRRRLEECGITLHANIRSGVVFAADEHRLEQLFTNLLENTCRYTAAPGRLSVDLRATAGTVMIEFADSAPGIAEHEALRIFEPLYRGDASRSREHGGAGLGLSICRKIVEAHGGTISARPSAFGGLVVVMRFPVVA